MPTEVQIYKDGTIVAADIANGAVTTAKIADANVTPSKLSTGGPNWNTAGTLTATAFSGNLTGNVTGNAINLSTIRTNWSTNGTITAVVGQLAWKNYGNNHTIFDASASTSPDGGAVNNTNPQNGWTGTYPTLMGWNGGSTYGVRVDSARVSDNTTGNAGSVTNGVYTTNFNNSLSGNGFQRLPGGLIIQWGQIGFLSGIGGRADVNFPIGFNSAVYSITATPSSSSTQAGDKSDCFYIENQSNGGFRLLSRQENGGCSYNWIAIGV